MASPAKRCLYEVLDLPRDCTAEEIRSAYRKLALQRHPDKLVRSGISESEATASFQELVNAYEVLSDDRERAWYDSHSSQILFSNSSSRSSSSSGVPDLFSFFSNSVYSGYTDKGKGFYKVYADVFDRIYRNELNFAKKLGTGDVVQEAPLMGNLDSPYAQANAFYGYWLGFSTVMDFVWEDQFDAMAGPNRKSRRVMEEENKKIRRKAKREYNDTVRGLAEFVKRRDKRVIDMQLKKNEEMEKKRETQRARKKEMEREKAERARAYQEPEWAKVEDEVDDEQVEEEEEEDGPKNEFYCVACGKKFKSEKQWKNHEQSKKHKEKVAELREAFGEEDRENEDVRESEENGDEEVLATSVDEQCFAPADDGVDKLKNQFEGVGIQEEEQGHNQEFRRTEEEADVHFDDDDDGRGRLKGVADELGLDGDDDENSVLEAMLSGHKIRRNLEKTRKPKAASKKVYVEVENEEVDLMEYNNKKGRRKRGSRKERGDDNQVEEEPQQRIEKAEVSSNVEPDNGNNDGTHIHGQTSNDHCRENENDGQGETEPLGKSKVLKQTPEKKVSTKKDMSAKSKNLTKGKKQKGTSKSSGHECDTCGVDFESRNKLHKHLNDTGHATLKSR